MALCSNLRTDFRKGTAPQQPLLAPIVQKWLMMLREPLQMRASPPFPKKLDSQQAAMAESCLPVWFYRQSNLENLHKNKLIDSTLGIILGLINGIIFISIFISIIFYSFKINDNTTERLKKSALFNSIYITKTVLVDYGE